MEQHRSRGVLAAGGGSINANLIRIHVRIFRSGGFDPRNAIRETGIGKIMPTDIMKRLRAEGGAHGVALHEDESGFRHSTRALSRAERFRHISALRAVVD